MKCYKVHWIRQANINDFGVEQHDSEEPCEVAEVQFVGSKRDVASFRKALRKMPHVDNESIYDEQVIIPEKRKQTLDWLNNSLNFKYDTCKGTSIHGTVRPAS